jgi:hypothetical protein
MTELEAIRAELESCNAQLSRQNAGLVAMARDRDKARQEVEALRAEVEGLNARICAVGGVLSANGCNCDCGCDTTGHFDECDTCLGCKINEALTDGAP